MGEIFSQYPAASWEVGGSRIVFPVLGITESGGNRLVRHARPGRDGVKLDDTGSKERTWSFAAIFSNAIEEPGTQVNSDPLYPRMLRKLIASFDEHETGTLTLPTVGEVRARAESYQRRESPEDDDQAMLDLVFVQDNEDALDRAAFQPPSVTATIVRLAEQTTFSAQKSGAWSDDVASLRERAAELQALMRAPGDAAADLGATVRSHRRIVQGIADTAEQSAKTTGGLFGDPRGSETVRQLKILLDRESAAEIERTSSRPRTRAFVVDVEQTSLFEIAARFNQDAEAVLELNASRVEDPFLLTRGQVIRIFETP